jgi:hypothetical protein
MSRVLNTQQLDTNAVSFQPRESCADRGTRAAEDEMLRAVICGDGERASGASDSGLHHRLVREHGAHGTLERVLLR